MKHYQKSDPIKIKHELILNAHKCLQCTTPSSQSGESRCDIISCLRQMKLERYYSESLI